MNKSVINSLEQALNEIHKENEILIEHKDYFQVMKNASTMCKIAETLSDNQMTNFSLKGTR